mmetsp:Transcript_10513/g.23884  ORF Transcript_10513/g.23884 Transcript_10513/m.23884 type:complete len:516 (+) Transcript_10513:147-1694(+)
MQKEEPLQEQANSDSEGSPRLDDVRSRLSEKSRQPYDPSYPTFHKACVAGVSSLGQRNLAWLLTPALGLFDTVVFFDSQLYPGVEGKIALTIDDAPCRQSADQCLSKEVCKVLRKFDAKATFFVSAGFVEGKEDHVLELLKHGHDIANHAVWDCPYTGVGIDTFEQHLLHAESVCEDLRRRSRESSETSEDEKPMTTSATLGAAIRSACSNAPAEGTAAEEKQSSHQQADEATEDASWTPVKWFRAPGGQLNSAMHEVIVRHGFQHVLGDCYANDAWVSDPQFIARMMVDNAMDGAILIIHMPERGFREHCLEALHSLLLGLKEKGLQAVTLNALHEAASHGMKGAGGVFRQVLPDPAEFAAHPARHMYRSTNFVTGFMTGARTMFEGVNAGISGVVLDPLLGWRYGGARGFASGVGSGVAGLVFRPVGGAFTGAAQMAAGVGSTLVSIPRLVQFGGSGSADEAAPADAPAGDRSDGADEMEGDVPRSTNQTDNVAPPSVDGQVAESPELCREKA